MKDKLLTTDNAKFAIVSVLSLLAIGVVYKAAKAANTAYNAVDDAVDSVVDPIIDAYHEFRLGDGVTFPDFHVSRMYRDYFDEDWRMNPEHFDVMNKMYPDELRSVLDDNNVLYEHLRSQVGE